MNPSPAAGHDARLEALRAWLTTALAGVSFTLAPASADASFRRYFRVTFAGGTRIAMDAPPEREDCRPFVQVAQLMREAGMHVPEVIAGDVDRGFLLLTDLGDTTYLRALTDANADALFADAIGALIAWQCASRPGVLPPYDRALLQREMDLFPEWYVKRHLALTLSDAFVISRHGPDFLAEMDAGLHHDPHFSGGFDSFGHHLCPHILAQPNQR